MWLSRVVRGALIFLLICVVLEVALRVGGSLYLQHRYRTEYAAGNLSPDQVTIVTLGESSTVGLWLRPEESYPAQLLGLLRKRFPSVPIRIIVPPHMGQNTSQMANRIGNYLDLYHPQLLIVMAGINNQWSLAESHIGRYLPLMSIRSLRVRTVVWLSRLRLYRVLRYAFLTFVVHERTRYTADLKSRNYVWGGPEMTRYPPPAWIDGYAQKHPEAFRALWWDDLRAIVHAAKARGVPVLLMTYHLHVFIVGTDEFERLAKEENIPLVRNDLSFVPIAQAGHLREYILWDGWHPNARGYAIIAKNAYRAIVRHHLLGLAAAGSGTDHR